MDEGPGIPAEDRDRIFERFYRIDASRSREKGGTVLGLSLVKSIAEAHAGHVELETEKGRGSVFRLVLPYVGPRL
jgi:two-component system OmpR family sensor kinase